MILRGIAACLTLLMVLATRGSTENDNLIALSIADETHIHRIGVTGLHVRSMLINDHVGVVGDDFGTGVIVSIYTYAERRWSWIAERPVAAGPCLFEAVGIVGAKATVLTLEMNRRISSVHPAHGSPLHLSAAVPCRDVE